MFAQGHTAWHLLVEGRGCLADIGVLFGPGMNQLKWSNSFLIPPSASLYGVWDWAKDS